MKVAEISGSQKNLQTFLLIGSTLKHHMTNVQQWCFNEVNQSINQSRYCKKNLENKFSLSDDHSCNTLLKLVTTEIAPFLTSLINQSFVQGIFPTLLKKAKVVPIHKQGSKLEEKTLGQYHC